MISNRNEIKFVACVECNQILASKHIRYFDLKRNKKRFGNANTAVSQGVLCHALCYAKELLSLFNFTSKSVTTVGKKRSERTMHTHTQHKDFYNISPTLYAYFLLLTFISYLGISSPWAKLFWQLASSCSSQLLFILLSFLSKHTFFSVGIFFRCVRGYLLFLWLSSCWCARFVPNNIVQSIHPYPSLTSSFFRSFRCFNVDCSQFDMKIDKYFFLLGKYFYIIIQQIKQILNIAVSVHADDDM